MATASARRTTGSRPAALAVLLLLATAPLATAQTATLDVTLRDAASGEPLPGATVTVDGTLLGAAADRDGRARLAGVTLPATVIARFVGYLEQRLQVGPDAADASGVVRLVIALERDVVGIDEVEVVAERLGEAIMRQVLARKEALGRRIGSYSMEAYTRLALERHGHLEVEPTLVRFTEVLSDVHWLRGNDTREAVVARRRVPDGGPFRYADAEPVPDFYFADRVELDGHLVPTPTNPRAFELYAFHAAEPRVEDGVRVIDIAVTPRQRGLLAGRVRVIDSLFVFAEAELRIPDRVARGGFVQDFDARYTVTFSPAGDSLWLPERFERTGHVFVGTTGATIPRVLFHQTTVVSRRAPALPGPSSLWAWSDRYYSPAGVYGGPEVFEPFRARWPLGEETVDAIEYLRSRDLSRLLFRQGMLAAYVRIPIFGDDDPAR
jgi:hypothetical protein